MPKALKPALLAIALLLASQAAAENITELRIDSVEPEAKCGSLFSFSYSIGNRVGPACKAGLEYWVGSRETRLVKGSDTIFLGEGETKQLESFLLIPETQCESTEFHLDMNCNDETATASRPIKITESVDTTPKILSLQIMKDRENEEFMFSYAIKTLEGNSVPATVEERVSSDGNTVWTSSQTVTLSGTEEFLRHGPMLPPAQYTLSILVSRGNETSKVTQDFDVKPTGFFGQIQSPLVPAAPLALLGLLTIATAIIILRLRKLGSFKGTGGQAGQIALSLSPRKEAEAVSASRQEDRNYVSLVETESRGTLEEHQANKLLDEAKFSEKEKKTALSFISQVPVTQAVRSSVFIDKFEKPKCETSITVTATNHTKNDWCDVMLLAKIPGFLSENITEISTDEEIQAAKIGNMARFTIPKIEAGQTASLQYSIEKWIPHNKAKLVPLPAVINYQKGIPLKMKLKYSKKAKAGKDNRHAKVKEGHKKRRKKRE